MNASEFIADALRGAFLSSQLNNYSVLLVDIEQPPEWQTWGAGLLVMCACSFSAPLGMLLLPCLSASIYERAMTFLIALGIGALSGSCFFVMIPQAFQLPAYEQIDYVSKSWLILAALYTFLVVDRALQYILEIRRRRQSRRKIKASTLKKIMEGEKSRQVTEQTTIEDDEKRDRDTIKNELEISVLNNAFARTFSTRRRVAVVKAVEGVEYLEGETGHSFHPHPLPNSLPPSSPSLIPFSRTHSPSSSFKRNERIGNRHSIHHVKEDNEYGHSAPLGTREFREPTHMDVVDEANEDVRMHYSVYPSLQNTRANSPTLDVPMKDINHKKSSDEVSISMQVVDKHVVNTAEVEIASVAYMIIFGSSANNFVDGMSMGAAFSDSLLRGLSIGIAVLSQQFPQELGTLAILVNSGLGLKRTLLLNLIPTFLSFVGFTVGVFLDNVDDSYDTYIFAISSGMYLYIFLGTLVPEIRESANELIRLNMVESLIVSALQCTGIATGIFFMFYMGQFNDISLE